MNHFHEPQSWITLTNHFHEHHSQSNFTNQNHEAHSQNTFTNHIHEPYSQTIFTIQNHKSDFKLQITITTSNLRLQLSYSFKSHNQHNSDTINKDCLFNNFKFSKSTDFIFTYSGPITSHISHSFHIFISILHITDLLLCWTSKPEHNEYYTHKTLHTDIIDSHTNKTDKTDKINKTDKVRTIWM